MFAGLVGSSSTIWLKHPWKLSTSTTESSWTRNFRGPLIGGCAICLHEMGSAFCMSHQCRMSALHWCQWCGLWLLLSGTLLSGQVPRYPLPEQAHKHQLERVVCHHCGCSCLGDQFKGKGIRVLCNSTSIMQIMAKCSSKSKSMMVLVCSLTMFSMQYNFDLCLQHVPEVDNDIADALSRFNHGCRHKHDATGFIPLPVDRSSWSSLPCLSTNSPPTTCLWHCWYRIYVHFQVLGTPLSDHATIPRQAHGCSHSSALQHIPRFYMAFNSLHVGSMGMLSICSSSFASATTSCLYLQIRRHYCTLPPSWPMARASSMELLSITYTGYKYYTLTWACQIHSKRLSTCINVFRPYIFSLTQSPISWPSHMICWY